MTPTAMATSLIRAAYRKQTHPDIPFIAQATGLPALKVSDLAAQERPINPMPATAPKAAGAPSGRPQTPDLPAAPAADPPTAVGVALPGGQVRNHHITAMHHVTYGQDTVVLLGCVCGVMLRAGVKELPRHWNRHRAGLP